MRMISSAPVVDENIVKLIHPRSHESILAQRFLVINISGNQRCQRFSASLTVTHPVGIFQN